MVGVVHDSLLQSCVQTFRKWLAVAPLRVKADNEDEDMGGSRGPYQRVLGCAYTHDKTTPSFFCYLDSYGEVVDFLRLNNLAKRKYTQYDREREEKEEDLKKVKEFVVKHRPDAVVLSAETRDSLSLAEEVREVLGELAQEEDWPTIPVEIMEANVACVFSKSRGSRVSVVSRIQGGGMVEVVEVVEGQCGVCLLKVTRC